MTGSRVNYFLRRILSAIGIKQNEKATKMMALAPALAFGIPGALGAIGSILGIANEARKLGGRVRLGRRKKIARGKGLSPMYIARPYVGAGLKQKKKGAKHRRGRGLLFPAGRGLSPMYIARPYVGAGIKRKHRKIKKGGKIKRVVHRRRVLRGQGMLAPPGGHMGPLLKQFMMPSTAILGHKLIRGPMHGPDNIPRGYIPVTPFINKSLHSTPFEPILTSSIPPATRIGSGTKKRAMRKRLYGRGVVADTLGKIPLLGGILAPIVRAFGGKIKHKRGGLLAPAGRGLSPMYIARPYVGAGLKRKHKKVKPKRGGKIKRTYHKKGGRHGNLHRMSSTIRSVLRGGSLVPRKGYYRKGPGGKRVHVRQTVVRVGAGLRRGGYLPYTWGPNINKCYKYY